MTLHRREGRALASPLRLLVSGDAGGEAVDLAWAAVQDEFAAVDRAMSRFREDSEITRLHRHPDAGQRVSWRLRAALGLADRARRVTGGRFDAGVLVDLERLGSVGVRQAWPGARARIGRGHVVEERGRSVRLLTPLDLGGVGKGLALRWAARAAEAVLHDRGFLLEAGGDLASRGGADGGPWVIGIEDPRGGGATPVATCEIATGRAIATSSIRLARWRDAHARPVHHLIDPRTGRPGGDGLVAVTVAGSDPAWAEIWSKALFLEGPSRIGEVARSRGLAAWWIDEAGELSMTPAARLRTTWVRAEARARPVRTASTEGSLSPLGG